ncbi:MAG: hypothetical protein FWF99_03560 [Desulfovibrionaceae bacterium]|nr:hypothetical protein [Desulfovibrionaceae bacterium]
MPHRRIFRHLCLLLICLFPDRLLAVEPDLRSAAVRKFNDLVGLERASAAAFSAARLQALGKISETMPLPEEFRQIVDVAPAANQAGIEQALALILFRYAPDGIILTPSSDGMRIEAHIMPVRVRPGQERERLLASLQQPLWFDYYNRAILLEKSALLDYDQAAEALLRGETRETAREKLRRAAEALAASSSYIELLPELRRNTGQGHEEAARLDGLAASLEELQQRAPEHYLIQAELGRLQLLRHHPLEARRLMDLSLASQDGFALAHDLRGVVLLALNLPSLALEDFNRAVSLQPRTPSFYENRALARKILQMEEYMCRDLSLACSLGSCAGMKWAAGEGRCLD